MTTVAVFERKLATNYTGSVASANEIVATASLSFYYNWVVQSHVVNGTLVIHEVSNSAPDMTLNPGEYLLTKFNVATPEVVDQFTFEHDFTHDTVSVGTAAVPTLLLAQSVTVPVTLKKSFIDTAYSAIALLSGSLNLLGALQVNSVTIVDEDTVDVVVQNTGLVTLSGASVLVVATKN